MTRLRYIGPIDLLSLPSLGLTVGRGDCFDVDDDVAAGLLEQADFEPAAGSRRHLVATTDPSQAAEPDVSLLAGDAATLDPSAPPAIDDPTTPTKKRKRSTP